MSSDISVWFADRLKQLRNEHNYTQEKLAELANVDSTYIGRLENLRRNPTLPVLDKIAKAFDLELWELLKK